ncbi:hypothetical protein WA158_000956 [Blastocystis sp. Blastoise]
METKDEPFIVAITRGKTLCDILREFSEHVSKAGEFSKNTKLGRVIEKDGYYAGLFALYERWLLIQELKGNCREDILIPSDPQVYQYTIDEFFTSDISLKKSIELSTELCNICRRKQKEFQEFSKNQIQNDNDTLSVTDDRSYYTFSYMGNPQSILKTYYAKMFSLYGRAGYNTEDIKLFEKRLFLTLVRYADMSGKVRGYQMALPNKVFHILVDQMKVSHECFASPFNCYEPLGSYCSRCLDTDQYFGSKGSFFDFYPEEGSFEANPPFVEECMLRCITHIKKLLNNTLKPLSFVLIVPNWKDFACLSYQLTIWKDLDRNEKNGFLVKEITVSSQNHVYRNGMGHQEQCKDMFAKADSILFVLQNEAGRVTYPWTDSIESEILQAWKEGDENLPRDANNYKTNYYNKKNKYNSNKYGNNSTEYNRNNTSRRYDENDRNNRSTYNNKIVHDNESSYYSSIRRYQDYNNDNRNNYSDNRNNYNDNRNNYNNNRNNNNDNRNNYNNDNRNNYNDNRNNYNNDNRNNNWHQHHNYSSNHYENHENRRDSRDRY